MPQHFETLEPRFPSAPKSQDEVLKWADNFQRTLEYYFAGLRHVSADKFLLSNDYFEMVSAGFSLTPDGYVLRISSSGAVSSDTTAGVKPGRPNQVIIVLNIGANNITLKHNATNLLTNGGVDIVLAPNNVVMLHWAGSKWVQLTPVMVNS